MSKINNLSEKKEKNNIRKNIRHRHKINKFDKRGLFQIYISMLKREHLIILYFEIATIIIYYQ